MANLIATIAEELGVAGHRGDLVLALAARALAARDGRAEVSAADVVRVAPFALRHRLSGTTEGNPDGWRDDDHGQRVAALTGAGG